VAAKVDACRDRFLALSWRLVRAVPDCLGREVTPPLEFSDVNMGNVLLIIGLLLVGMVGISLLVLSRESSVS
jgi:hypothetical protein